MGCGYKQLLGFGAVLDVPAYADRHDSDRRVWFLCRAELGRASAHLPVRAGDQAEDVGGTGSSVCSPGQDAR